jgi:hypothetical protein
MKLMMIKVTGVTTESFCVCTGSSGGGSSSSSGGGVTIPH